MRNKILIIIAILAMLVSMTGIVAAAVPEQLTSTWTGSQFESNAWNFHIPNSGPQYYQLRYYPPGQYPSGQYSTGPLFVGYEKYIAGAPYYEVFIPTTITTGEWTVVLYKAGTASASTPTEVTSERVMVNVNVPIPEFPTVALPIAAVIGLVFFFQHKKRKEE